MANTSKGAVDERVTKRKVTMTNVFATAAGTQTQEAVDYVRPDLLDAYVTDARTRWQLVEVSDEPDAGPGGYDGDTTIPAALSGAN